MIVWSGNTNTKIIWIGQVPVEPAVGFPSLEALMLLDEEEDDPRFVEEPRQPEIVMQPLLG